MTWISASHAPPFPAFPLPLPGVGSVPLADSHCVENRLKHVRTAAEEAPRAVVEALPEAALGDGVERQGAELGHKSASHLTLRHVGALSSRGLLVQDHEPPAVRHALCQPDAIRLEPLSVSSV